MQVAKINEKALKVAKQNNVLGHTVNDHFIDPVFSREWLVTHLKDAASFKRIEITDRNGSKSSICQGELLAREAKSPSSLNAFKTQAHNARLIRQNLTYYNVVLCYERDGYVETVQTMTTQNTSGNPELKILAFDNDAKLNLKKGVNINHSFVGVVGHAANGQRYSMCMWYLPNEVDFNGHDCSYFANNSTVVYEMMKYYLQFLLIQNGCPADTVFTAYKKTTTFLKAVI